MVTQGFYAVDTDVLYKILEAGGNANEISAYLVLANHTSGRGNRQHSQSTAGAKAVHKKTGLSYRKSKKSLEFLEDISVIQPIDSCSQELRKLPKFAQIRWSLSPPEKGVTYLPHSLVEATNPSDPTTPLQRVWNGIVVGRGVSASEARIDALLLLVSLYKEHQMQDFGGVNPSCVSRNWSEVEFASESIAEIGHVAFQIEKDSLQVGVSWLNSIFSHIGNEEEREDRFARAFNTLKKLKLLYEVVQVWDSDPRNNDRAELVYPLYVLDYHARQSDPYSLPDVHRFMCDKDYWDGMMMMETIEESIDQRSLLVLKFKSNIQFALGSFRLRFRPKTEDVGAWFLEDEMRVSRWKEVLAA